MPFCAAVRVKSTIDWRAELAADEADHARGHIAGVFQKGPEKSYRAELDSKSETHVYTTKQMGSGSSFPIKRAIVEFWRVFFWSKLSQKP